MVLCEEIECGVCYLPYSRMERVPRVLHCQHTFCANCLNSIAEMKSRLLTVRCPLCRQMTCVDRGLELQQALWVDTKIWDQIPESEREEEEEEEDEDEEDRMSQSATQPER
ncbi:RN186 protein, partial [Amia calva]|nr:RN186 protein [Amia calva]